MWPWRLLVVLFTVMSFGSAAWSLPGSPLQPWMPTDQQAGEIHLRVVDPKGAVVPNANVNLLRDQQRLQASGSTNDVGMLTLAGLCGGSYELEVAALGFQTHRQNIQLKAEAASEIEIRLDPMEVPKVVSTGDHTLNTTMVWREGTAGIALSVIDPTGAVVSGAKVQLKKENDKLVAQIASNQEGRATLTGLPVGSYIIEVSMPGFKPHKQEVKTAAGTITNVQVKLDVAETIINCSPCAEAPQVQTDETSIQPILYVQVVALPCDQPKASRRFLGRLFHKLGF